MKIDVTEVVEKSVNDLIDLALTDSDCHHLEIAITRWVTELIENIPDDIEWYKKNDSRLQRLIFEAEYQTEQLAYELPIAS